MVLAAYGLFFASPYELRVLTVCGIFALLVIGFQYIFGHVGAVSLAQATFFGLGAYVTGVLGATYELGFLVTFPLSCLVPLLLAMVVGIPVLKLEEHYFALATLGIGLVVVLIAVQWQEVTGGTNGLPGVPSVRLLGVEIRDRLHLFIFVWSVLILGALIAYQVTRGLYGRVFHLVRESRIAASSLGIDVDRLRFNAFLLSAFYGGAAGALMAHVIRVVSPENLELSVMITCLTMTVIGGRTRIAGAIVGAILIVHLRESFRILESYTLMAYGAVTLLVLIAAPYGLIGALERLRARLIPEPVDSPPTARQLSALTAAKAGGEGGSLLEVERVSKHFGGVRALEDVSLHLYRGEVVGLIGPNGSGKTTLVNIVSGLYRADAGRLTFKGQDITNQPPHLISRLGMARTFQHINLADDLTALDNIAVARATRERSGLQKSIFTVGPDPCLQMARRNAMAAAEMLGIGPFATTPCGNLPYGTRRRVEVARAVATEPELLLLDEPAAGLNEEEQRDLAARIRRIADFGITVLVIEHNLVFLRSLAERLVCLDHGQVIASGSPEEVQRDAAVIEAYLGRDEAPERGQTVAGGDSERLASQR
ncbi:MAG TPA: branched-chain amino acid ABC transporter ATP-binding protein/permease [Alphaproteobacteria bacterium]|nr:branched-chain amino acid ABC transporter ATP-binding protein/permease [Alphaproteobacteria bacterium]